MLTVVIPIYNDAASLRDLIHEIKAINLQNVVFLIIDNGSTDPAVWGLLSEFEFNQSGVKSMRVSVNLGFGGAVCLGLQNCDSDFVGWMPGNLKVSPSEALRVFDALIEIGAACAKGLRSGRKATELAKSFLAGLVLSLFLGTNMRDFGGTPTVGTRQQLLPLIEGAPEGVDFDAYMLFRFKKSELSMTRPRIHYGQRVHGKSHWQRGFGSEIALLMSIIGKKKVWSKHVKGGI